MIWPEYLETRARYRQATDRFTDVLEEQERLFQRTQLRATDYTKDKVQAGGGDPFAAYLIEKEAKNLDAMLLEAKRFMEGRRDLLEAVERDLRESQDVEDRIFELRFLRHWRVKRTAQSVHYSARQVINISNKIRRDPNFE